MDSNLRQEDGAILWFTHIPKMGWSEQNRVPDDFHTILTARTDVKPVPKPTSEPAKTVHSDLPY